MRKLLILIGLTTLAVSAQEKLVGKEGPFSILKISERGKYNRCAASMTGQAGMLRIAWRRGGAYSVSVPSTTPGRAEPTLTFFFGPKVHRFDAQMSGPRAWAAVDNTVVEKLMNAKQRIDIQLYLTKYTWLIGNTDMTNVFQKLEDCAHDAEK